MAHQPWAVLIRTAGLLIAMALVLLQWDALSDSPDLSSKAGAIDHIFGARPVLIALRVGLVAIASYVVSSVVALTLRGSWLTKIGPRGAEAEPSRAKLLESNLGLVDRLDDIEASVADIWETLDAVEAELEVQDEES